MSESSERKIKLLLLYEILRKQTDERHPMTMKELSCALQKYDITVSRQTLYEDIEVLNRYGFDIVSEKGKRNRYYIDRRFQAEKIYSFGIFSEEMKLRRTVFRNGEL